MAERQLTKTGDYWVVGDEADILQKMDALHTIKKQVDQDAKTRKSYEARLKSARNTLIESRKEYRDLDSRLHSATSVDAHNRLVGRYNALITKVKNTLDTVHELEDSIAQLNGQAEADFVDQLQSISDAIDAANDKYDSLKKDSKVTAAVAASGAKLGPSTELATAAAEIKKLKTDVESEAIPLHALHGVQMIAVLLNGKPVQMVLDSGASVVTVPSDLAAELQLVPTEQDPVMQLKIADGNTIQAHLMTLKSVRVGRFIVENVRCAVFGPEVHDAPVLLGNTFLSHFVVKIDQASGQLHLSQIDAVSGDSKKPSPKPVLRQSDSDN